MAALQPQKTNHKNGVSPSVTKREGRSPSEATLTPQGSKNSVFIPEPPFIALFIGKPKSGKTYAMKNMLRSLAIDQKKFKFGRVFSTSGLFNDDWVDVVPEHSLKEWDIDYFERYVKWMREIKKSKGNIAPNFVIFDDLLGSKKFLDEKFMLNFFSCFRHTNTSVFISAQYIGKGTSTLLREIANYVFIWRTDSTASRDYVFENFGEKMPEGKETSPGGKKKKFLKMLDAVTAGKDHRCLLFDATQDDPKLAYLQYQASKFEPFKLLFRA